MHFTSYLQNNVLTIVLTGEIDHQCAKKYIDEIASKVEVYMPNACILDFEQVVFMDSSGIAVVINAMRQMNQINGKLAITGLKGQPMRVVRVSGIDKLVEINEVVT